MNWTGWDGSSTICSSLRMLSSLASCGSSGSTSRIFTQESMAKAGALVSRQWADEPAEGPFFADRHRLTEAVMNLAHNAIQHTAPE